MPKNHNKLNFAKKTGVALMASIALGGCAADSESPAPTVTVTATETVAASPPPSETLSSEDDVEVVEGLVVLGEEQRARVSNIIATNALNRFMEVHGKSTDMYNGFGQLMAEQESDGVTDLSYVRFANTPDGVALSTESLVLNTEDDIKWGNWMQFSNDTPGAIEATKDGVLTTLEAEALLSSPATEFEFGHYTYGDRTVTQVVAEGEGVSVATGLRDDATYNEHNNILEGLTPVSDVQSAEATLNTFLNS